MAASPAQAQNTYTQNGATPAPSASSTQNSQSSTNMFMQSQAQSAMGAVQSDAAKQAADMQKKMMTALAQSAAQNGQNGQNAQGQPVKQMTQAELDEQMKDPDSAQYKADRVAERAKKDIDLFGLPKDTDVVQNVTTDPTTPPNMEELQHVHETNGSSYAVADDLISKELALDMRRDSQREAALSYGARGGLAKKTYFLMEKIDDYAPTLDGVFNFRQLLIKAPSGMLIEPPIVREALDALVIEQGGDEAAVADQVLKINKKAKIVSAPRDWRQYLVFDAFVTEIAPPPRVLWPKDKKEQADWNTWVKLGWDAGFAQGEEMFDSNINRLVADYNGMVRYRMLLAQGKISKPFAMQEDRGVTGGRDEMRVGDRALRITGPSQFLTGANLWKPADR